MDLGDGHILLHAEPLAGQLVLEGKNYQLCPRLVCFVRHIQLVLLNVEMNRKHHSQCVGSSYTLEMVRRRHFSVYLRRQQLLFMPGTTRVSVAEAQLSCGGFGLGFFVFASAGGWIVCPWPSLQGKNIQNFTLLGEQRQVSDSSSQELGVLFLVPAQLWQWREQGLVGSVSFLCFGISMAVLTGSICLSLSLQGCTLPSCISQALWSLVF